MASSAGGSSGGSSGTSGPSVPTAGGQSVTALWLHNKLGTSNDSWTGGSIVSQLNPETLEKIRTCFQDLEPQVKLKLLLSLFHIPRRNLEAWRSGLEAILDVGQEDSEPWVCMLAELMKTYPASGQLNSDIHVPEANRKIFTDLIADLKKALKRCEQVDSVLPIECHYLNKNAFMSVVGHQPQQSKHFTLKRKPKAAALKAELMNKSQDAANKLKSASAAGLPMRKSTKPRKMSDVAPLKGLPSRTLSGFKNNARASLPSRSMRKPEGGGVKLLDINEQPIGLAAKKRKRQQELEEARSKTAANNNSTAGDGGPSNKQGKQNQQQQPAEKATPDYAAVLGTMNPPTPAPAASETPAYAPATPSYAPEPPQVAVMVSTSNQGMPAAVSLPTTPLAPSSLPQQQQQSSSVLRSVITQPAPVTTASGRVGFPAGLNSLGPLPPSALGQPPQTYTSDPSVLPSSTRIVHLPNQPLPQARLATPAATPTTVILQQPAPPLQQHQAAAANSPRVVHHLQNLVPVRPPPPLQQQAQAQPTVATVPAPEQQRRSLTLTKEQMLEAQEMFRTANKVTRPEKALILGFMAGSRDNPCPHLGNVVTIKLSENKENVLQTDSTYLTMIVETHFQMNYSSGEWKRIRKYRRMED